MWLTLQKVYLLSLAKVKEKTDVLATLSDEPAFAPIQSLTRLHP